jgi:hypothetical protein
MAMLVVAALYVMGGLVFLASMLGLMGVLPGFPPGSASLPLVGSGIMLGLASIGDSLARINAKLK